jgi:pimeloyl-ACP methyl ester carboxylesterase
MQRRFPMLRVLAGLAVVVVLVIGVATRTIGARAATSTCAGDTGSKALTGTIDGADYTIEVPASWNGTLLLYSHGYRVPGPNPATDVGDPLTGAALLSQGFALAGSSYSQTGWALQQAFHDQIALLDFFDTTCGHPTRTIAWGHSLGGIITAGLVQLNPGRFAGALPMCGVVAGGIGTWNQALDSSFAFDRLLAGNTLPIVNLASLGLAKVNDAYNTAQGILFAAQSTAQGRARTALVAALTDVPGWFAPLSPEPAATDYAAQEANQYAWESQVDFYFAFFGRADLEGRAGGNPSWNTDVNYRTQLAHSADAAEVTALYAQAGLNLDQDLQALNSAPRIAATPSAVKYLNQYITFNGQLTPPVLTMHTTGDGLVVNQDEQSYAQVIHTSGDTSMLRQIFVHRAFHCTFTPAETLTALHTLIHRVDTGHWSGTTSTDLLNQEAAALGPSLNVFAVGNNLVPTASAFTDFTPTLFLRPFTSSDQGS